MTNSLGSGVRVHQKTSSPTSNLVTWDKLFTTLSLGFSICEGGVLTVPSPGFAVRIQ